MAETYLDTWSNKRRTGDVTAKDLAAATGLTIEAARKQLESRVRDGRLARVIIEGYKIAYRRAQVLIKRRLIYTWRDTNK